MVSENPKFDCVEAFESNFDQIQWLRIYSPYRSIVPNPTVFLHNFLSRHVTIRDSQHKIYLFSARIFKSDRPQETLYMLYLIYISPQIKLPFEEKISKFLLREFLRNENVRFCHLHE